MNGMMRTYTALYNVFTLFFAGLFLWSCTAAEPRIPESYSEMDVPVCLFPDYKDVVIPPNIAPLNFRIEQDTSRAYVVSLKGVEGEPLLAAGTEEGLIQFDTLRWHDFLSRNKGRQVEVSLYAQKAEGWKRFPTYNFTIASEEIDAYLSYRLIEPGYELYRQLGLYQRNLTNWDVHTIYENNRVYDDEHNHCINCHNYRNYSTEDMLFHVRSSHGGTVMVEGDKARKVIIKDSTILTSGVYPSWHPGARLVAFSTNLTGQAFHLYHPEKVEVLDMRSDLLLYDPDKNEVSHILRSKDKLETFPAWSPDGAYLYYCEALMPEGVPAETPDSLLGYQMSVRYDSLLYSLKRMPFDVKKRTFGMPEMVVDAASRHRSITFPRVSPDGRFVLYGQGDYGQFHIWHKSSDLWVKDLQNDTCYALKEANSPDVDSYHSWSSNGRWIVFSSRRLDGNYTRPFIAYFDKEGRAHKAFLLPQEDPEQNVLLLKSYNVPELTRDAVRVSQEALRKCIYQTEGDKVKYIASPESENKEME